MTHRSITANASLRRPSGPAGAGVPASFAAIITTGTGTTIPMVRTGVSS